MVARFLLTCAVQMQAILLGWRMYELTKDALHLGMIGLVEAVPAIGLALFAGLIIDRGNPLRIWRGVIFVCLLSALLMLLTQGSFLKLSIQAQVLCLYASSFTTGLARAFSQPSMFALVPRIVAREFLHRSSTWMTTVLQVARISGPALGGILYAFLGISGTSVVVSVLIALTLCAAMLIDSKHDSQKKIPKSHSIKDDLLSGAYFVMRHRILFPALSLDMVSVLFGGVTALLPIFAAEVLHTGSMGLGMLRASPAVGATVMSYFLLTRDVKKGAGKKLFASVFAFGVCIIVFSLSHSFLLSLVALALSGAVDSVSMVIRTAAVQLASPEHMRGRISAVNSIFIGSSNELGEFESGIAAKMMGLVPAALFGGVVCLGVTVLVAVVSPSLRKLDLDELAKA